MNFNAVKVWKKRWPNTLQDSFIYYTRVVVKTSS